MVAKFLPVLLFVALLNCCAPAQISTAAPSCGDARVEFRIKTTDPPTAVQPQAGKGLVYFIAEDKGGILAPTTRAGLDGDWVGATHGSSWFFFQASPGLHHLCALVNSSEGAQTALVQFTAQAGGVYSFDAKRLSFRDGWSDMTLLPLDNDEGRLMIRNSSFSTSQPRK